MYNKPIEKNNFSRDLKLEIIQKYLLTNKTQTELAREHNINGSSYMSNWINSFNFELKQLNGKPLIDKKKHNSKIEENKNSLNLLKEKASYIDSNNIIFTKKQKFNIIKDYLSNDISQNTIAKKYCIKWRSNIHKWVKSFEEMLKRKKDLNIEEKLLLDLIDKNKKDKKPRFFSKKFKESIIEEYEKTNITKANLSRKYNIGSSLISSWILNYESNKKTNEMKKDGNTEIKSDSNEKLKHFLETELPKIKSTELNLLSRDSSETLSEENKKLKRLLSKLIEENERKEEIRKKKINELKGQITTLEDENYKKEQNLEYEKFKSIAYSTLIDIAEKELKIEIRKKFDAKQ